MQDEAGGLRWEHGGGRGQLGPRQEGETGAQDLGSRLGFDPYRECYVHRVPLHRSSSLRPAGSAPARCPGRTETNRVFREPSASYVGSSFVTGTI